LRYLLDTVVVSERSKSAPHPDVLAWLERQSPEDVVISAVTLGELRYGVERLEAGSKRRKLNTYIADVERSFRGRILALEPAKQRSWATIRRKAEQKRRTIPTADAMLAATAELHGLTLVTRNTRDFEGWAARC
jgi:predicted nucleic acid-binding protein